MNRLERLNQSPQEMEDKAIKKTIAMEKLELEGDILETQYKLEEEKARLENLKNSTPLQIQEILNCQDSIEAYERGFKAIKALQKELY